MKTRPNKEHYLTIAYILFVLAALLIFSAGFWNDTGAAPMPTTTPDTQYWQLLITDDAWLITEPGCNLQTTQYGGSYHFVCVEDLDAK